MNRYKLTKAGVNANEGIARFNGNQEVYEECLNRFMADTHFQELQKAIEAQDVKAAFAASHALKGEAGNLSLTKLYADIVPLVEELRARRIDGTAEMMAAVGADYEAIIEALKPKTE